MAMTVGGSLGVTYPDSTNIPANKVTLILGSALTDTSNTMLITGKATVDGTNGVNANGSVYGTAQLIIALTSTQTNYDLYTAAVSAYGSTSLPPNIKLM